jgi:hypothetical protein
MAYTLNLTDKAAADILVTLGRLPADQVGDTYADVKAQLYAQGYKSAPAPSLAEPMKLPPLNQVDKPATQPPPDGPPKAKV